MEQIAEANVESIPGTPQNVAAKSAGDPAGGYVDLSVRRRGVRQKAQGLGYPMPPELGGGKLFVRTAACHAVAVAREKYELNLRNSSAVKRKYKLKPGDDLTGAAARELTRYTALMAIVGWEPEAPFKTEAGDIVDPGRLDAVSLRAFIEESFLPKIDPLADEDPEEMDTDFFVTAIDALSAASDAPAEEVGKVGKDFKLGPSGSVDYSG